MVAQARNVLLIFFCVSVLVTVAGCHYERHGRHGDRDVIHGQGDFETRGH